MKSDSGGFDGSELFSVNVTDRYRQAANVLAGISRLQGRGAPVAGVAARPFQRLAELNLCLESCVARPCPRTLWVRKVSNILGCATVRRRFEGRTESHESAGVPFGQMSRRAPHDRDDQ